MDSFEYSSEGYLVDPEELSFIYTNKSLYTLDEVFNNRDVCTILLGEAGVGKSSELKRLSEKLKNDDYDILYYNFEIYTDVDEFIDEDNYRNNQFNKEGLTLILIDSIEEVFGEENEYFRKVLKVLNNRLKQSFSSRIKIMLTCRTSYWDDFIEKQLDHLLQRGQSSTYYLGALTKGVNVNISMYTFARLIMYKITYLLSLNNLSNGRIPLQL